MTSNFLLLIFAAVGFAETPAAHPDPVVQAVRDHYERVHARLAAAVVEYSMRPSTERAMTHGEWYSLIHSYEPGRERVETLHFGDNPLITATDPGDRDPLHNIIIKKNGISFQVYLESGTVALEADVSTLARAIELETYLSAVGLPNPEARPYLDALPKEIAVARKGLPVLSYDYFLPYALRDPNWRVSGTEMIGTAQCQILTRSIPQGFQDTIWVDTQNHFAIHKRRFEDQSDALEYFGSDFQIHDDEIALPKVARLKTQLSGETRYELTKLVAGRPDPKLFDYSYPAGALIHDQLRGKGKFFVIPGGEQIPENFAERVRRYLRTPYVTASRPLFDQIVYQWLMPLAPSFLLAAWFVTKLRETKSNSQLSSKPLELPRDEPRSSDHAAP